MREVKLYGHLGERFGRSFMLDVKSPAEAIRALKANLQGFEQALINHPTGYHIFVGKENIGRDLLTFQSDLATIKIVPYIAGAKAGAFQTVLGAVLVIVSMILPFTPFAGAAPYLANAGYAMMIGGVATMLFSPPPSTQTSREKAENTPSYSFNGAVNTTAQGNCVPICYGRMIVGSQIISAGLSAEQIMSAPASTGQTSPRSGRPYYRTEEY
jgi:predicted phage tail protein